MQTLRLVTAIGARPNFMKIAPFIRALDMHAASAAAEHVRFEHILVHTGQHYDDAMSEVFFRTLGIPKPDINLGIGSGTHAEQVGRTMIAFEKVIVERQPDWVIVVGDVNATCACSITAKKQRVNLAHIEAGLRSFDMTMPEEVNRIVTDRLSDLLFTPDRFADANLLKEGVPAARIHNVGNIMIDTLDANRAAAAAMSIDDLLPLKLIPEQSVLESVAASGGFADGFAVLTLHRPSNVDQREVLSDLVRFFLDELCRELPLIWTVHPRTRARLEAFGLWRDLLDCPRVVLVEPLDYLEMLRLNMEARLVLTDSGGLQEECCVLGTPCLTLRPQTERPVTLEEHGGVSRLVGNRIDHIRAGFKALHRLPRRPSRPPLWDGHTSERIVRVLADTADRA